MLFSPGLGRNIGFIYKQMGYNRLVSVSKSEVMTMRREDIEKTLRAQKALHERRDIE